jgi:hypothetical protein
MNPTWFDPNRNAVLSYTSLRRSVGWIGVAIPPVLPLGAWVLFGMDLQPSISAYYYTGMRDVFVGSMCAIGVFLLSYRFGKADDLFGDVAGVAAIGIALFPTTPERDATGWARAAGVAHLAFAAVFFAALAAFSLFLFTRSDGPTPRKLVRNTVYRICGWVIIVCLVLAVVSGAVLGEQVKVELRPLFWLESLAVLAFGVSWLVKGEALLRDRPGETKPDQRDHVRPTAAG